MPGRSFVGASGYRYGFNGKEKDDEASGNGNSYDFEARLYDPRLGRWYSIDPLQKKYPGSAPYVFVLNCPILFRDVDGRDLDVGGDTKKATEDIRSLVPEKYQACITVTNAGKVEFDASYVSAEDSEDAGIKLVSALVSSKSKFIYEVMPDNNGAPLKLGSGTYENNSDNPRMATDKKGDMVKSGYNGEVIIHPNAIVVNDDATGNEVEEPRGGFVFHELKENFERTELKKFYMNAKMEKGALAEDKTNPGAHQTSSEDATKNLRPELKNKNTKEGFYKNIKIKASTAPQKK
jgi:RHS repeat-associated protein